MKSPILGAAYVARSVNAADNRMVNLFPEAVPDGGKEPGFLQRAPGLRKILTVGTGPIRGMRAYGGDLYVVSGDKLYRITSAWNATEVGTVTGSGPVSLSDNGTQLFIATNPDGFIYNRVTNLFAPITDPDFPGALQVGYIDGYFVFSQPNSQQFWITDLFDGQSIDPLDFASAEAAPDDIIALIVDHREIWLFGSNSIEVFVNSGDADFPFQRIDGAFNELGCLATWSVAKMDNSVFWLGADARGDGMVYKATGYTAVRISTHAIEWQIQTYGDVSDAQAFTYQQDGHSFYVLNFPAAGKTWVYDVAANAWHERAGFDNGKFVRYRAATQAAFNAEVLVGDYEDGRIYAYDLSYYEDDDRPQKWLRSWRALPTGQNNLNRAAHHELQLDCETGVGLNGIDPTEVVETDYLNTEDSRRIVTETSGSGSWEALAQPSPGAFAQGGNSPISSNGSRLIAIRATLAVYTSDDQGITWILRGVPTGAVTIYAPVFANGVWVMPSTNPNNRVYRSVDNGETWTFVSAATSASWGPSAYGGGAHVQVASNGLASQYSLDNGLTWTAGAALPFGSIVQLVHTGVRFVVVSSAGNSAWSTDNGVTWNVVALPSANAVSAAANGNTIVIALTGTTPNYIESSDGGLSWTLRALPTLGTWTCVRFGGGVFLITGNNTASFYSTTGVGDWIASTQVLSLATQAFAYAAPWFVSVNATSTTDAQRFRVPGSLDSIPIILDKKRTPGVIPKVMLRWSDDGGHTWSNEHWRELGRQGQYGTRVIWRRLGMTLKLRDRVYELSGTDPVRIYLNGAELTASNSRD